MSYYSRYYLKSNVLDNGIDADHLQRTGPTIPILITLPDSQVTILTTQGKTITPVSGLALIDTGASSSVVDGTVITALGATTVKKGPVSTPSGSAILNFYPAKFSFPGTKLPDIDFNFVLASEHLKKDQNIIALIGRDILKYGSFVYNGDGHISLSLNL